MLLLLSSLFDIVSARGIGVGEQCCEIALAAYREDKNGSLTYPNGTLLVPADNYTCGQSYNESADPAPDLAVPLWWCRPHCPGYAISPANDTIVWATPLIQYILPAVIFSMIIPRRLVLTPHRWLFNFRLNRLSDWTKALLSFCVSGLIFTVDTILWVFMIMIAPGPFILSGLLEVTLDYGVIRHLKSSYIPSGGHESQCLNRGQRVELLIAVLAGNLEIEGGPANPQDELGRAVNVDERPEEAEVHLRAMLACQYPFGAAVGAPILLYIGSFVYNLATLHKAEGDQDTARALAFGIWWMILVHVAAISACLLASNNPSTAAAIVSLRRKKVSFKQRLDYAQERFEMEDRFQARLEALSNLPLSYSARYEPVWMWTRGKNKERWLRRTAAWEQAWFREKIQMTTQGWILLAFVSYLLIFFPCALAFWIEYTTPAIGVGCRSLTILLYACTQFVFVLLSAWSHFKVARHDDFWRSHRWLAVLRRRWVGMSVANGLLLPAWIVALFTVFAGTLMQITGEPS